VTPDFEDVDSRPSLFVSLTTETLATVAAEWQRPEHAPEGVQKLLAQARRLFVGAAGCYDNLAQAELVALQAAELILRVRLGPSAHPKATLGQLANSPAAEQVLTQRQLDWFRVFAVHWRNKLAHPDTPTAVTPGMAAELLEGVHRIIGEMSGPDSTAGSTSRPPPK